MILLSKVRTLLLILEKGSHWRVLSRGATGFASCGKLLFYYKGGFYGTSGHLRSQCQLEDAIEESAVSPSPHGLRFVLQLQNKHRGHLLHGSQCS